MKVILEHLDGLGPFVVSETGAVAVNDTEAVIDLDDVSLALGYRTVAAAYLSEPFDVPRPRSLVSPDNVARLADRVRQLPSRFRTFRVSAASSDSDDLTRWREAIADATGLVEDDDDAELLIRLRKKDGGGWEVLLRLTPRPLSTRTWRTERYEGGLNACIAAAAVRATSPSPEDRFVDLMCGAGTLLIERLAMGLPARCVGYDISADAIEKSKTHLRNAAIRGARVDLRLGDVLLADEVGGFDKLVVNLPWGTSVGSHEDNATLYPAVLDTAARMSSPHATLCVLTHEIRVFESALDAQTVWHLVDEHRFFQKGHWPRLFVLAN